MILIQDVLELHKLSIKKYGGSSGIRDIGLLESAIARPFQTFGGEDLYPTVLEKAAAMGESLIVNHPFVDGNKRTGLAVMHTFLKDNNISIKTKNEELYNFIINISTGSLSFEQIVDWLKANTTVV